MNMWNLEEIHHLRLPPALHATLYSNHVDPGGERTKNSASGRDQTRLNLRSNVMRGVKFNRNAKTKRWSIAKQNVLVWYFSISQHQLYNICCRVQCNTHVRSTQNTQHIFDIWLERKIGRIGPESSTHDFHDGRKCVHNFRMTANSQPLLTGLSEKIASPHNSKSLKKVASSQAICFKCERQIGSFPHIYGVQITSNNKTFEIWNQDHHLTNDSQILTLAMSNREGPVRGLNSSSLHKMEPWKRYI